MSALILTAVQLESQAVFLKSSLIILYLILAALALSCIVFTFIMIRAQLDGTASKVLLVALYTATCFVLICAIVCTGKYNQLTSPQDTTHLQTAVPSGATEPSAEDATTSPSETKQDNESLLSFTPEHTADTDPANWEIKWNVMQNSNVLDHYVHPEEISFDDGHAYTNIEGITTFRGNSFRDTASYGTADIITQTITKKWESKIGTLNGWSGCGWTGQPLIARWDEETKAVMNLYEEKKTKPGLVEVIYATLDGHIYFYDLDDGSYTRDPIDVGMNFMGSGSLDPRGYPLMYVGSGATTNRSSRMYVISLIEGKVIYEQSGSDIDAYRRSFTFDSAPLIDAETDTLIWPGESGMLYFIKLNTNFAQETGTISVQPENLVKLRYKTNHSRDVGTDSSSIIVDHYLYYADNGGMFFCVDMNTMDLVWTQDTHDDVNATPVFQRGANGEGYIYTGTSMKYANRTAYIHKLDARTGEILWEYTLDKVTSSATIAGGVHSSPILGKPGTTLEGMIIYCIARTPRADRGTMIALDTETGEVIWEQELPNYTLSSPVAVYTDDGVGYFVLCDSQGKVALHDGATGNILNSNEIGSPIEASPAVFENTVIVGSRGEYVYGFSLE